MHDPFNPKNGEFAKNIRSITGLDDTELRQSLKTYGWHPELPAIVDENDIVLVGHRRMRLAKQLGIDPVIKKVKFGSGNAADAERVKLAVVSNIGNQPFSKDDRKRIAEYLYGQREWTMERIAEALNVTKGTVSKDLAGIVSVGNNSAKGKGRPKGAAKTKTAAPKRHYKEDAIIAAADSGLTMQQVAQETGIGKRQVRHVIEREKIRREAQIDPQIDPATLSMSAQEKLQAAMRQQKRQLEAEYEQQVRNEVRKRLEDTVLPHYKEKYAEYDQVVTARKGVMDRPTFNKIRNCLHPARVAQLLDIPEPKLDPKLSKLYDDAFHLFMGLEVRLLNEKDKPTAKFDIPSTYEELMAAKQRVAEQRKAKRAASNKAPVRR